MTLVMENSNYNAGGTGANLFAGGAQAGQAASQVIKHYILNKPKNIVTPQVCVVS